jgi:D-aspartate ligase
MAKRTIGVLVTGGDFQALAVLRTLTTKGIPVVMIDHEQCIGKYSRFPKRFFKAPPPTDEQAYVGFLIELAKKQNLQGWVIFPNSDEAVYAVSKHKQELEEYYRVPTQSWDIIQKVYIKELTYKIAEEHGIPCPKTFVPRDLDELKQADLKFPVVVKPSIRDHYYSKVKAKAYRCNNMAELIETYKLVCKVIDPSEVLVQDLIPGGPKHLYSFCPFLKDGKVLTAIMARRARQHPMDFGHATTFAELVDIPEIRESAEKFLDVIGYYGVGEVEFMQDQRDGVFKLIEMNPRLWGWHSLAIAAGADLPYLLYLDQIGEKLDIKPPVKQMKWVRLITDLPTVALEIIKRRMSVGEYLASMRGRKTFAVPITKDPLPFIMEILMIPYLWLKRGF